MSRTPVQTLVVPGCSGTLLEYTSEAYLSEWICQLAVFVQPNCISALALTPIALRIVSWEPLRFQSHSASGNTQRHLRRQSTTTSYVTRKHIDTFQEAVAHFAIQIGARPYNTMPNVKHTRYFPESLCSLWGKAVQHSAQFKTIGCSRSLPLC